MTAQFQDRKAGGGDSSFSFPFLTNSPPLQPCVGALPTKEGSTPSSPLQPPLQAPNPHCVKKLNFRPEISTPGQVEAKIWTLLPLFSFSYRLVQMSLWAEHYLMGVPVKEPVSHTHCIGHLGHPKHTSCYHVLHRARPPPTAVLCHPEVR